MLYRADIPIICVWGCGGYFFICVEYIHICMRVCVEARSQGQVSLLDGSLPVL